MARTAMSVDERIKRFWDRVIKTDTCWLWTGFITDGYGIVRINPYINERAHRVSYELHYGEIPTDKFVCHTCDVRNCVNPEHLYLGTPKDNTRDCVSRERFANGRTVLTHDQIRKIRAIYSYGYLSQRRIARMFGVDPSVVSTLVNRVTWANVEGGV